MKILVKVETKKTKKYKKTTVIGKKVASEAGSGAGKSPSRTRSVKSNNKKK